jgi:hypothetical protein
LATTNKNFRVKNGLDVGGNTVITGDANVTGKLSITASAGDEGGEIFLSNAATNTTITNGVTIDIYKDRLRFFEQGGTARGFYVDITTGGSAASTNLVGGGGGSASDSFSTISANGTSVVADSSTDTLTITPGDNVQIVGNATSDTITFTVNNALSNITSIVTPNYITFDTTPTGVSTAAGTMYWDDGDGIPKAILNANVTIGLGQESVITVKNATGNTITKGTVVYINGAQGQMPTVALADADTEATSSKTFGFAAEQILNDGEGFVVTEGVLRGVNTASFTEGGAIWLSSTAGQYTQTIPAEPAHSVFLGYAVKAHASAGEVIVKIQNGYELTELHGVVIEETLADNEVLAYDSTSGLWKNQTAEEAGVANLSGATFTGNVAGTNISVTGNVNATTVNATTFTGTAAFADTAFSVAISNVSSMGTNVSTFLTTPNSINFLNTITDETGTGNVVFSTSPVLTTPNIGAAIGTSLNVTANLNASTLRLTATDDVTTSSTTHAFQIGADNSTNLRIDINEIQGLNNGAPSQLFINNEGGNVSFGTTGGSNVTINGNITATSFIGNTNAATITGTVADGTTTTAARGVGYMGMPQNSISANTVSSASDAGEHIYMTVSGIVYTVASNANVALPIGTTIVVIGGYASGTSTIGIQSTDTLRMSGTGATGTRTLAAYGMATLIKVAATTWFISGNGLT